MPDFSSDTLQTARDAGYTDDQIYDYWSQKDSRFDTARQFGYKLDDVASHLTQNNVPSLPEQVVKPQLGLGEMLFDYETAQNLRAGIQDIVYSLPGMAKALPGMVYKGLKLTQGTPEEQAHAGMELLSESVAQGQQMAADVQAPLGSRESFRGIGNVALMAAPALGEALGEAALLGRAKSKPIIPGEAVPPVAETVKPPVQDRQLRVMPERRFTMNEPEPTESKVADVNRELAPLTESPEATAEPFPSISRSAEDQRRVQQQQEPSKVRQAISLDELRLMRERQELNLQNDIAKRVTGGTHPAVDERLGQIDDELTNIANKELQTQGGGDISNATQERVIEEGSQPEYTGDGEGGPPSEAGGGGSFEPSPEVAGTQEVKIEAEPQAPAATAPPEKVQSGEFQKQGYTAVPTEEATKPPVQAEPSGISTERLQETYGKDAVLITKGRSPEAFQKIGQADKRDPYEVLSKAQQAGIAPPDDVPVMRAEHQRLLNDARAAYGTPEYNELAQRAVDFSNSIKTVAHGPASDIFRSIQDYDKPRFDSPADFDNIIRERMNRESTPIEKKTFQDVTDEVKTRDTESRQSADAAQKRLNKFREKDVMKFEDAVNAVKSQIKDLTEPCVL